jgi:CheY-like chemotaxis protein
MIPMALESLLVTTDSAASGVVHGSLRQLEIHVMQLDSAQEAAALLLRRKFDAVVADCDDLPGGGELLPQLRRGTSNRSSIVFALVNGGTPASRAFEAGANFVLEKPLDAGRSARNFGAALHLMRREHRRYFRLDVNLAVNVDFGNGIAGQFTALNLSKGGLALAACRLPAGAQAKVSFTLPDDYVIACDAEVAWSSNERRTGLRLLSMGEGARGHLCEFIERAADAAELRAAEPKNAKTAWNAIETALAIPLFRHAARRRCH